MSVTVQPVMSADLPRVGDFLHRELNPRLSAGQWARSALPTWPGEPPNHGFLLEEDGAVVGVLLAFYATREVDGVPVRFCNLGAWCVLPDKRFHSLKLLRAALAQPGLTFTDLSPSGNVVQLNERLGYEHLSTQADLVPCLPWPTIPRRTRVRTGRDVAHVLTDAQARLHSDHHGAAAARHVVLSRGDRHCYVVFRRDRRKGLPVFASLLHVSDPALFREVSHVFSRHLLTRHRTLLLLAERRLAGRPPRLSRVVSRNRPKMVKNAQVELDRVDYLYSELACVAW